MTRIGSGFSSMTGVRGVLQVLIITSFLDTSLNRDDFEGTAIEPYERLDMLHMSVVNYFM